MRKPIIIKNRKGQTLIETAFVLIMLTIIVIGLAEFARAWFLKSSLKNAVRNGARVAVATPGITPFTGYSCSSGFTTCPATSPSAPPDNVRYAVCCQPGVPRTSGDTTVVALSYVDTNNSGSLNSGDTVTVTATYRKSDFFIVGDGIWPWSRALNLTVDASMRYE